MSVSFCHRCRVMVDQPAAHAMVHELTEGPWEYLRARQWERLSPGGWILVMPPCFSEPTP